MIVSDKGKCLAVEGGKICGKCIKGKNPTNVKVHLRSTHREANLAYLNKVKENAKPPVPETEANPGTGHGCMGTGPGSMMETTAGQRTLQEGFQQRPDSCWLVNTHKHEGGSVVNVY